MVLSLSEDRAAENQLEARFVLEDLGLKVTARRSRVPIDDALRELDSQVLWIGGVTVAAALVFAALLARGLSRPLVELARQASEVMKGEPRPDRGARATRGGRGRGRLQPRHRRSRVSAPEPRGERAHRGVA